MIKKIDHINISVTDLEESKKIFIDLLGFRLEKEEILKGKWMDKIVGLSRAKAKYAKLVFPNARINIELIQYYNPLGDKDPKIDQVNRIGFRHVALEVKNIDKEYQRLKNLGVHFFSNVQIHGKKRLCYFSGPDKIILELAEYN
ncbi:VOC family protein [Patescibacteria group bacterium]|nr:VOC family protein [Patescibacteria group bacterium]MBU1931441.1 VOC family protein [Patescibacteria group bacterium]